MLNLAGMIQSRAWNSLLEIQQRLNVTIEIVDDRLTPLLPPAGDQGPSIGRRTVGRLDDESLKAVVQRAMQSRAQQVVAVRDGKIACTPIAGPRGDVAGVLLIADPRPQSGDDHELKRISSCLARAIETHLAASSTDVPSELHELSSLYRLLTEAVATGSRNEVIRAFVEALAVWLDAESWAYLRDLTGRFSMKIALPGSDRSLAPPMFEADPVPEDATLMRLSTGDRERLGFDRSADIVVSHAHGRGRGRGRGRAASPWLIATRLGGDAEREARLALYADVLDQMLGEVAAVESSRLTWAMLQHLLGTAQSPDRAAEDALGELSAAVEASASVAVFRDGVRVLIMGGADCAPALGGPLVGPHLVVLPLEVASPYSAVVSIGRSTGSPFTPREESLSRTAVATFSPWLSAVVQRLPTTGERRSVARSFDQVVERYASTAVAGYGDVSMIVVSSRDAASARDIAAERVGHIRPQLRAADLAGRLISGEIGILLPDTSMSGARKVAERIRHLMTSDAAVGRYGNVAIGVACCPAGSSPEQSLLGEARAATIEDAASSEAVDR
jgi:hypothetical protein